MSYAQCILSQKLSLEHCVGSLECTKNFVSRSGRSPCSRGACYRGNERSDCLAYLNIISPISLCLNVYEPEEEQKRDMSFSWKSSLRKFMQYARLIEEKQICFFGDKS